ncbi:MAG: hypothetical protein J7L26_04720 [Candidatus Aminicenantes bacterium]|nr:hypothetical protein [Candidatus Aminicenantes bacterium]
MRNLIFIALTLSFAVSAYAEQATFEFAMRSARKADSPFDWLIGGGLSTEVVKFSVFTERENGGRYWGLNAEGKYKYRFAEINAMRSLKTAQKINVAKVALLGKWKSLGLGAAYSWQDWKPAIMAQATVDVKWQRLKVHGEYATNFQGRYVSKFGQRVEYPAWRGLSFAVVSEYQKVSNRPVSWRVKMELACRSLLLQAVKRILRRK